MAERRKTFTATEPGAAVIDVAADDPETLRRALERLEEHQRLLAAEIARLRALASLGEGVATIAHEIRNPLGAIAGFAELLARRCEGHPELRDMSQKIMGAAQNLNVLVQRLLELVRNTPIQIRPVEWPHFLNATLDQFEEQSRQRGARLTLVRRWPERLGEGRADALCLRQAVWNVLENAEQVSSPSGQIEVDVSGDAQGGLRLRIADRGPGIDPALLPRLFTPFVTTREHGTGLGLATARKIVEAHGGRIAIRNRRGGGAEVEIDLPGAAAPTRLVDPQGDA
ncbi:MAG TPA: ATP-binding protein [bacterium]|nr:ATP-binding protein [bacterium]